MIAHLALDLAQEAWRRVLRTRHSLKPGGNFPGYLCTIATNIRTCCGCPEVVPRALLKINACLDEHGSTPSGPVPERCRRDCPDVLCAPCRVPASLRCVVGDALNRCSGSY